MSGHGPAPDDDLAALRRVSGEERDALADRAPSTVTGRSGAAERADLHDKYDRMTRLADVFDTAGAQVRAMARLGEQVLREPALADSAEVARTTYRQAEDDVRAATTGRHGLLARSVEVDADALVVRATVSTYRWIDDLQSAAYDTLGSIAGRAIGYLAPNVDLGGAVVSAGLIETDALDRDGVASYLSELAANNPELMDHVTTGGGGLLDGLQMRSVLTVGALARDDDRSCARGGLRAIGAADFEVDGASALRDVAGGLLEPTRPPSPPSPPAAAPPADHHDAPGSLAELMATLSATTRSTTVRRVAPGRWIAFLTGPGGGAGGRLRLVGGDSSAYAAQVVRALDAAVGDEPDARVMLVGTGTGGVAAAEVAAGDRSPRSTWTVEQVVTAGAPSAQVPRIPDRVRVLSLEDRSDPVALLGSLVNASAGHRVSVVFDGTATGPVTAGGGREAPYVAGGRAADRSAHPDLRAELDRLRSRGFLAP